MHIPLGIAYLISLQEFRTSIDHAKVSKDQQLLCEVQSTCVVHLAL